MIVVVVTLLVVTVVVVVTVAVIIAPVVTSKTHACKDKTSNVNVTRALNEKLFKGFL